MKTALAEARITAGPRPGSAGAKRSLRAKGILGFVALVLYLGTVGYALRQERLELSRLANRLEHIYTQENAHAKVGYALQRSIFELQEKLFAATPRPGFEEEIALDVELVRAGLQGLLAFQPAAAGDIESLDRGMARLRLTPSRSALIELRNTESELETRMDRQSRQLRENKGALWARYRAVNDTISVIAAIAGLLGAVFFGAALTLFLTRLTWDIKKVAARAVDVASGYRGAQLEVTRHDEVGDLMHAINRMQSELRQWEQQLEISRQQQFHKEKMAAIGSLAAAVAHEINNPIAAIAGIAQSMQDAGRPVAGAADSDPSVLILEQTKRIATISRQIAELTAPHSPEPELLDLNALVRNTCSFIGYDKRFRSIDLALDLDSQIPAINAIADHLTQVLMNLLINAADALENASSIKPAIRVATQASDGEVIIMVSDNGKGMDGAVLARAFDESYTTKPPNKGRGLGLFLCKSLIEGCGNRIELDSTPGVGTTARIHLLLAQQTGT